MYRTWRFARSQSCHRIWLCRSSQNKGISLFFSFFLPVEASGVASRWLVAGPRGQVFVRGVLHPIVKTLHLPKPRRGRLFRCSLRSREEKKLAHLAGYIAGDGSPLRPCQCLIQIRGFQYPESTHVLFGLDVRSVGDEHVAVGLLPQRLRVGGRGNAAGELPRAGSNQFAVERVDLFHHRFGYGGRVEVVGEVITNQILWHDFFSLFLVLFPMTRFLLTQEPWLIVLLPYSRSGDRKSTATRF